MRLGKSVWTMLLSSARKAARSSLVSKTGRTSKSKSPTLEERATAGEREAKKKHGEVGTLCGVCKGSSRA